MLIDFDCKLMRLGLNQIAGPVIPFACCDAPLRLGFSGWYGELNKKVVLSDASIRPQKVEIHLHQEIFLCHGIPLCQATLCTDQGTCDVANCHFCQCEARREQEQIRQLRMEMGLELM